MDIIRWLIELASGAVPNIVVIGQL